MGATDGSRPSGHKVPFERLRLVRLGDSYQPSLETPSDAAAWADLLPGGRGCQAWAFQDPAGVGIGSPQQGRPLSVSYPGSSLGATWGAHCSASRKLDRGTWGAGGGVVRIDCMGSKDGEPEAERAHEGGHGQVEGQRSQAGEGPLAQGTNASAKRPNPGSLSGAPRPTDKGPLFRDVSNLWPPDLVARLKALVAKVPGP